MVSKAIRSFVAYHDTIYNTTTREDIAIKRFLEHKKYYRVLSYKTHTQLKLTPFGDHPGADRRAQLINLLYYIDEIFYMGSFRDERNTKEIL